MQEYIGIKVVHAEPQSDPSIHSGIAVAGYTVVYDKGTLAEYVSWSPADKFEESYLAVSDGQGVVLKGVCALAMLEAMNTEAEPANDQPSNAELGKLSDDTLRGMARLAHNTIREFLAYEGLLHNPPFDLCNPGVQQGEMNRISAIVDGRTYFVDRTNKAEVLKDRFRHTIIKSILA